MEPGIYDVQNVSILGSDEPFTRIGDVISELDGNILACTIKLADGRKLGFYAHPGISRKNALVMRGMTGMTEGVQAILYRRRFKLKLEVTPEGDVD